MKYLSILFIPLVFTGTILMITCTDPNLPVLSASIDGSGDEIVNRGKYLVSTFGCNDCHSPKRMGAQGPEIISERMLSGYPAERPLGKVSAEALGSGWVLFNADLTAGVGPWGAVFASNLTPHETGIGNWTLTQFELVLTQGGGHDAMPSTPWHRYNTMNEEDVRAIYSYLQSIPPVNNQVPEALEPFQLLSHR